MKTAIIVLLFALAVMILLYYRQGKLLDKISDKYISDHKCLHNFANEFFREQ